MNVLLYGTKMYSKMNFKDVIIEKMLNVKCKFDKDISFKYVCKNIYTKLETEYNFFYLSFIHFHLWLRQLVDTYKLNPNINIKNCI
jgi:hypothetical protein